MNHTKNKERLIGTQTKQANLREYASPKEMANDGNRQEGGKNTSALMTSAINSKMFPICAMHVRKASTI